MTRLIENIPPYARNWVTSFMDERIRRGYSGISEKNVNEINRWLERKIKILRHMTNLPVEAVEIILLSQINSMSFEDIVSDFKRWSYRNAIEDHDIDFFRDFQFDIEEVCTTDIGVWYKIDTPEGVIFEDKNSDMLNKVFLFYENGNNIYVLRDSNSKTLMIAILNKENDQIIFSSDHRDKITLPNSNTEYEVFILSPDKINYLNVLLSNFKVKTGSMNAFSNIVYIGKDETKAYRADSLPENIETSQEMILSYFNIKNLDIKKINTDLIINNCYNLTDISDLSSEKNIFILDCINLENISNIKTGEHLLIHLCNNLKNISGDIYSGRDCYITSPSGTEINIDANFVVDGDLVIQSKSLKKLKGKIRAKNLFLQNCINLEEISADIVVDGIIDLTECVNLRRLPQSKSAYWRLPYGMVSNNIQDANNIFYNSLINTMNEKFMEFKKNIIKSNENIIPIIHLDAIQCVQIEEYKNFQYSLDELLESSQIFNNERKIVKQGLLKIMRTSPSIIYAFHHMNANNMIEVLQHLGLIEASIQKEK